VEVLNLLAYDLIAVALTEDEQHVRLFGCVNREAEFR
jgi:hypothetical protein